jgi:hypothetical protein
VQAFLAPAGFTQVLRFDIPAGDASCKPMSVDLTIAHTHAAAHRRTLHHIRLLPTAAFGLSSLVGAEALHPFGSYRR